MNQGLQVSICVTTTRIDRRAASHKMGWGRLLAVALCGLLCEPCSGWWARTTAGGRDLDVVRGKAADLWKAANETHAVSVDATQKAAAMNAAAMHAEEAAAKAGRGSMFGKARASPQEMEALAFVAKEARALADTAQQRADALGDVAHQARKRADKADELVEASQQTIKITNKLAGLNVQLVEADNALQAAESRLAGARALVEKTAHAAEERGVDTDTAQRAVEEIQTQVFAAGAGATEELFQRQKDLSAAAKEHHRAFAEAVKHSVDAQRGESSLAVEVAAHQRRVIEAQHAISAMELELKGMQAIEAQFDAVVDSTNLEAKLAQLLSEKSALEQKVFNVTTELTNLNKSHHSERILLVEKVSNVTAELQILNASLNKLSVFSKSLQNSSSSGLYDVSHAALPRQKELEILARDLNESCRVHENNVDRLLAESRTNETKRIEEMTVLNASFQKEREKLANASRMMNETLEEYKARGANLSHHVQTASTWEIANNTKDAATKAQLDASAAHDAVKKAESKIADSEPSFLWRWFVSVKRSKNLDNLKRAAVAAQNTFSAAMRQAQALERLHRHHDRVVTNLTEELESAAATIEILKARTHSYESFLPDPMINPRRWLMNLGKDIWYFFGNLWRSSVFLTFFLGMAGVFLSQLLSAPKFAVRFMEFLGVDLHVLYGLCVCFWLGNMGWSWGWLIFCSGIFISTIGGKRTKRIKSASCMAHRLPIREIDNRVDTGFDVEIHVIDGIINKSNDLMGKGDPFVEIQVGDESKKTKTKMNTHTPKWDEKKEFHDIQDANVEVVFVAKDADLVGKDTLIGSHALRICDILHATREGERSPPQKYFLRTTDMGMTKGFIMVSWLWRTRAQVDFQKLAQSSSSRRQAPEQKGSLDARGRRKYRFDPHWGTAKEADDSILFLDTYAPGVTAQVAGTYHTLQSFNINPNGIHIALFSLLAFLCGRFGLDVGYVIPLSIGLYKAESTLSAVLCRVAWEKRPNLSKDIRTRALFLWQQAFVAKEDRLDTCQLWSMFQCVREEVPYWLRETETSWLNNLLGMFWMKYNKWISSYVANLIQSFIEGIADVEEVKAGSGFPKLVNSVGSIAHPKDFPKVKDKIFVTVVSAKGIHAQHKMSEMFRGDFDASCDPYVRVSLESWPDVQKKKLMKRTKTKTNDLAPAWHETFQFDLPRDGDKLLFEMLDDDLVNDEILAVVEISSNDILQEFQQLVEGEELEKEYSMVSEKGKRTDMKIKLKFRVEIGIKYAPQVDSNRVFQLDTDVVWDTDLTIKVRKGILIEVKVISIRLPLRVTLEWLDYDVQMRKCPIMSTCGMDFVEFRRQWQEWADNAHWPMPARIWLDLRSRPSLQTEIKSSGVGDVWKLPFMKGLQSGLICDLIYSFFPFGPITLKDPAPFVDQQMPTHASASFINFMDSSENGGVSRRADLRITFLRAKTDPEVPLHDSNYYCVIRYGKMRKLEPPLDKEILIDESQEHIRFSSTQWRTHDPSYANDITFTIHDPGCDMITFEMYRVDPKQRKDPAMKRNADTLVLKRKFRLTEFIDHYGIIPYPRYGNGSDRKSLKRLIHVQDASNPGASELTVIAQIVTTESERGNQSISARNLNSLVQESDQEDVLYSCLEECQVGLSRDENGSGCPGTLLVQLSAPSKQAPGQLSAGSHSRSITLTLSKSDLSGHSAVVGCAVFHETLTDSLAETRSTLGPVFHFEIPELCCNYSLDVSDGDQSVRLPIKKMTLGKDGYFEAFAEDLRPPHEAPDTVAFPAIVASFLPHVPKSMPQVILTIHRVEGLPWSSGKMPPDAFCKVSVTKEARPAGSSNAAYGTYDDFVRAKQSGLPVYDGGKEQEVGIMTPRCKGTTSFNFCESIPLSFEEQMLHDEHDFHQVVHVEVLQVNEHGEQSMVGSWHRPIRDLYLEFLRTRKVSDEGLAKHGGFVGASVPKAFPLDRQKAPWSTVELEFEYRGNWMHVTEAHEMWWDKQEQAARAERGKLEAEVAAKLVEEGADEALEWRRSLKELQAQDAHD